MKYEFQMAYSENTIKEDELGGHVAYMEERPLTWKVSGRSY
jgi:hypothetical protein